MANKNKKNRSRVSTKSEENTSSTKKASNTPNKTSSLSKSGKETFELAKVHLHYSCECQVNAKMTLDGDEACVDIFIPQKCSECGKGKVEKLCIGNHSRKTDGQCRVPGCKCTEIFSHISMLDFMAYMQDDSDDEDDSDDLNQEEEYDEDKEEKKMQKKKAELVNGKPVSVRDKVKEMEKRREVKEAKKGEKILEEKKGEKILEENKEKVEVKNLEEKDVKIPLFDHESFEY